MINGFHFLIAVIVIYGFVVVLPRAIRADRADAHLIHHPNSNCPEYEES